ncbi:uncharacterized protein KY384_008129 [Bacidia gigantensis]|uniref:uncharacterized protein n=1 Tax=Bacidia gigantensis TaxID=2732470 RepID=UPI001D056CD8|nr:uncharacterized protein KY384_008129 [Bacidia gigantensis]KAG8526700.1 hypothetical protein KY384_008129 [Bacidia gigantensis]
MAPGGREIYAATYSNVPVYEFNVAGNHVMRRRCDDYINATHILKVADYDKPARTRILEREVQKGTHEKIQGGLLSSPDEELGTWIPLPAGRELALKNGVFEKLQPIFDYVYGESSPPPAPKHATNPNRPRVPKQPGGRKAAGMVAPSSGRRVLIADPGALKPPIMSDDYEPFSSQPRDDDSQDAETIASTSYLDGDDAYGSHYNPNSRKRKRVPDNSDQQHTLIGDRILDYFMLSSPDEPFTNAPAPPTIPRTFEVNRPIDDDKHCAIHWAVAMGDIPILRALLNLNADIHVRNKRGETPLIKAVMFTNNFTNQSAEDVVTMLQHSLTEKDHFQASVLHHTVMTTNSRTRRKCAVHYLSVLLKTLERTCPKQTVEDFLNSQDRHGDTALHIAARFDSKRCIKMLKEYGAASDIANYKGETTDQLVTDLRSLHVAATSSSPPPMDLDPKVMGFAGIERGSAPYKAEAARSFSASFDNLAQEKALQLALAIEKDFKDKEESLRETEQALEKNEEERQQIHQASLNYTTLEETDDSERANLEEEYEVVYSQSVSYSEQTQHRELHQKVRAFEQALPKTAHNLPNGTISSDQVLEEQAHAAIGLAHEQSRRRRLTRDVAEAQAYAGMGATGQAMKQLVADTTGVSPDDVPALAPELLDALEADKMEYAREPFALAV